MEELFTAGKIATIMDCNAAIFTRTIKEIKTAKA